MGVGEYACAGAYRRRAPSRTPSDKVSLGRCARLRGECAQVVDRRTEERVAQVEQAGPERRAVGNGVETRRRCQPLECSHENGELEVDGCHAVWASAHSRTVEHGSPLDELACARARRTTSGLLLVPARARSDTERAALRDRRLPSRLGLRHAATPPDDRPPSPASHLPSPSAREAGRKRATRPRTRAAARRAARPSSRWLRCPRSPSAHRRSISDLDDDGENHRPATRPVVDDLPDRVVDVLLEELDLGDMLCRELTNHTIGFAAEFVQ